MTSLANTITRELGAYQTRDLTAMVKQVQDVLAQMPSEEPARAQQQNAAEQAGEASGGTTGEAANTNARNNNHVVHHAEPTGPPPVQPAEEPFIPPRPDRPLSANEKLLQKLRKKMREMERIEQKLADNGKVDPLQMQKLTQKGSLK